MKLELNFIQNGDGKQCVVISSPSIENGIVAEMYCENYDHALEVLSNPEATEEEIKGIIANLAAELSDEDPKENLKISVWRNKNDDGIKTCGMMATIEDGVGCFQSCSTISISNKEYKQFCKGSTMQKINMAYHTFKDQIESGIFDH